MRILRAIALTVILLLGLFCAAEPTASYQQTVASCDPPPDPPKPPKKGKHHPVSFRC
jgi:hypothetical protein